MLRQWVKVRTRQWADRTQYGFNSEICLITIGKCFRCHFFDDLARSRISLLFSKKERIILLLLFTRPWNRNLLSTFEHRMVVFFALYEMKMCRFAKVYYLLVKINAWVPVLVLPFKQARLLSSILQIITTRKLLYRKFQTHVTSNSQINCDISNNYKYNL